VSGDFSYRPYHLLTSHLYFLFSSCALIFHSDITRGRVPIARCNPLRELSSASLITMARTKQTGELDLIHSCESDANGASSQEICRGLDEVLRVYPRTSNKSLENFDRNYLCSPACCPFSHKPLGTQLSGCCLIFNVSWLGVLQKRMSIVLHPAF